jgi:hypothetical protein
MRSLAHILAVALIATNCLAMGSADPLLANGYLMLRNLGIRHALARSA